LKGNCTPKNPIYFEKGSLGFGSTTPVLINPKP
jgi:hypothetical protein